MTILDRPDRFGLPSRLIHWTIAALVGLAWLSGQVAEGGFGRGLHMGLGALVLGASLLRLLWRVVNRAPPTPPGTPDWQAKAAVAGHLALYALTLAVPLAGLFDRWARGRPVSLFGILPVPAPFTPPFGRLWGEVHELAANLLLLVVALHVAAALWHHLILRDGVLRRMLPGRASGPEAR